MHLEINWPQEYEHILRTRCVGDQHHWLSFSFHSILHVCLEDRILSSECPTCKIYLYYLCWWFQTITMVTFSSFLPRNRDQEKIRYILTCQVILGLFGIWNSVPVITLQNEREYLRSFSHLLRRTQPTLARSLCAITFRWNWLINPLG